MSTFSDRDLETRLEDPIFRREFELEKRKIETVDAMVNLATELEVSQTALARTIYASLSGTSPAHP